MKFYTFFKMYKSKMLLSHYEGGIKFNSEIKIKPYMFVPSAQKTSYKNMEGNYVEKKLFSSPFEARQFIRDHEEISGYNLYGSTYFDYVWINDNYKDLKADNSIIRIGNYDIETDSDGGYADIKTANKAIISISIHVMSDNEIYCFGLKDAEPIQEILDREGVDKQVIYIKCESERDLLIKFVETWQRLQMDVITGWNIRGYDHTYLIRRLIRLFGEDMAKSLSPFGIIEENTYTMYGREQSEYDIVGIPTLDYMECYKKFSFKNSESYKLDYISHVVLEKKKLDYSEYKTLNRLYQENPALFYTYNVIDIVRVAELEDELKFIELIFSLSHFTRTNLLDSFATVKPCDVVIHNKMMEYNTVIPHKKAENNELSRVIAGGYVKDVLPGLYQYVMSFDFTSLYPHIIMAYNISPDAYMGKIDKFDNIDNPDRIIHERVYDEIYDKLIENNMCITAKGTVFSREKKSFFAQIMEEVFAKRKEYKDIMLEEEKNLEEIKRKMKDDDSEELKLLYKKTKSKVVEYNNSQLATKIFANAFYGGLANVYSRWFSYDIAESITLTGQLASKYVEKYANDYFNKLLKTEKVNYVIAVDTDSAYFNMEAVVKKAFGENPDREEVVKFLVNFSKEVEKNVIEAAMDDLYKCTNAYQKKFHMKLEVIAQAIWRKAKNYVMGVFYNEGVFLSEPKIKMKGIEAVKSSTPEVCRDYIKKSIPIILNNDRDQLINYIEDCREEFYSFPFEKVAKPGGVNGVSKYGDINTVYKKGTPLHVRGSLLYNKLIDDMDLSSTYHKIQSGDKIKYTYLTLPNPLKEDVISTPDDLPEEFNLNKYIDYEKQFEKTFLKPIESLATSAGISLQNKVDISQFYE